MRPFTYSEKLFQETGKDWHQAGEDVTYTKSQICYNGVLFQEKEYIY